MFYNIIINALVQHARLVLIIGLVTSLVECDEDEKANRANDKQGDAEIGENDQNLILRGFPRLWGADSRIWPIGTRSLWNGGGPGLMGPDLRILAATTTT